jgi:upstream activation factor subunit UAF30
MPSKSTKPKKTSSKKSSTKTTSSKSAAPAPAPAPTPTPTSKTTTPETTENVVVNPANEQFTEFAAKLQQVVTLLSSLKSDYKSLEKLYNKEVRVNRKLTAKKKRKQGNRQPSGFVKPTQISEELAEFLGKDKGTEMARTAVTKEINQYIRENNLQDPANGRKINPDQALTQLLKLQKSDELTYFNLQKYMSPHFAKAGKPLPCSS